MQQEAALQLPPTIADLGSWEIKEFGWKEMKSSNYSLVLSPPAKN